MSHLLTDPAGQYVFKVYLGKNSSAPKGDDEIDGVGNSVSVSASTIQSGIVGGVIGLVALQQLCGTVLESI